MIDLPPPSYYQTIETIVRCDIPRANIRIKYEDYLQSDEVTVSDLGIVSDEKLRCLKIAVHPFYILTILNQAQQAAFHHFSRREDRPRELVEAREWVRSKGLLDKLPIYDPKQSLEIFAAALESACGLKLGVAVMQYGQLSLTIRPDFLLGNKFDQSSVALECLVNVFSASDAIEHGVSFGFIGNEALAEETKK